MTQKQPLKENNENRRTLSQNAAIHLYMTILAQEFNDAGLDMKKVLKPSVDISWNVKNIKEYIWKPIQQALKLKISTTQLTTTEVNEVYECINKHIGEKFRIHIPFPSYEQTDNYIKSYEAKKN